MLLLLYTVYIYQVLGFVFWSLLLLVPTPLLLYAVNVYCTNFGWVWGKKGTKQMVYLQYRVLACGLMALCRRTLGGKCHWYAIM